MGVLYIIGNGVDIGLGLPTRYTEFRDWLKENRPKDFQKISKFYSANDEYWSDLENNLAKINEKEFDKSATICGDEAVLSAFYLLKTDAVQWANEINGKYLAGFNEQPIADFKDSIFINFNYTMTMTALFKVRSLDDFHLHGDAVMGGLLRIPGEDIVLGHGDDFNRCLSIAGQTDYLDFVQKTKKDPSQIFSKKTALIERLEDPKYPIDEVRVVGCSYSPIDFPYFPLILNYFPKSISITLFSHETTKTDWVDSYEKQLKGLGYKKIIRPGTVPWWLEKQIINAK